MNLLCNGRALIRVGSAVASQKMLWLQYFKSSEPLAKLELEDLDLILRERRLHWFGHVEHSSGAVRNSEQHVIYRLICRLGQGNQS